MSYQLVASKRLPVASTQSTSINRQNELDCGRYFLLGVKPSRSPTAHTYRALERPIIANNFLRLLSRLHRQRRVQVKTAAPVKDNGRAARTCTLHQHDRHSAAPDRRPPRRGAPTGAPIAPPPPPPRRRAAGGRLGPHRARARRRAARELVCFQPRELAAVVARDEVGAPAGARAGAPGDRQQV